MSADSGVDTSKGMRRDLKQTTMWDLRATHLQTHKLEPDDSVESLHNAIANSEASTEEFDEALADEHALARALRGVDVDVDLEVLQNLGQPLSSQCR